MKSLNNVLFRILKLEYLIRIPFWIFGEVINTKKVQTHWEDKKYSTALRILKFQVNPTRGLRSRITMFLWHELFLFVNTTTESLPIPGLPSTAFNDVNINIFAIILQEDRSFTVRDIGRKIRGGASVLYTRDVILRMNNLKFKKKI